jgi:Domain of unknown function (DUF4112)
MPFFSKKVNSTQHDDVASPTASSSNQQYSTMAQTGQAPIREESMHKEKSIFQNLHPDNPAPMPELNSAEQRAYETAKKLQYIMDDCIKLPCCDKRVGIDPIIGLIPGFGDFGSALISLAIVARMAPVLSRYTVLRMLVNVWIDAVTGVFPIIGDLFDIGWKANQRNVLIFEDQMKVGGEARMNTDRRWVIMIALGFTIFCFVTTIMTVALCVLLIMMLI